MLIRTDGQPDMDRSTLLVILFLLPVTYFPMYILYGVGKAHILYGVGNAFIYLWGRKRFLYIIFRVGNASFYVTYFPTNLVDPFTQRVTGIKIVNLRVYNGRFFICICALLRIKNYLIHMHNVQKNIFHFWIIKCIMESF